MKIMVDRLTDHPTNQQMDKRIHREVTFPIMTIFFFSDDLTLRPMWNQTSLNSNQPKTTKMLCTYIQDKNYK